MADEIFRHGNGIPEKDLTTSCSVTDRTAVDTSTQI